MTLRSQETASSQSISSYVRLKDESIGLYLKDAKAVGHSAPSRTYTENRDQARRFDRHYAKRLLGSFRKHGETVTMEDA